MSTNPTPNDEWAKNRKYGVIIDAGSSGSRVYVYSWKDHEFAKELYTVEELKGKIPIVERADKDGLKWTSREEPGISTYGTKPDKVGEHLDMLLDFSKEVVPIDSHSSTPIFLMATAGMRLLPEEQQRALLDSTCNYIREKTGFFMSDCDSHIKIISGELEGVYGWVAVNYLMGGFDNSIKAYVEEKKGEKEEKIEQHHTFGFLDMGGASAQIAFEPEHHQKEEHMHDLTRITLHTLDGRTVDYDVFVTTFLGYGSNEARRRYLEDRVKKLFTISNGKKLLDENHMLPMDDPCLPLNLNITDTFSTSVALALHGTGDFNQCIENTISLLNKDADCPSKPCLFNGVHTPDIDWSVNKFVGISEYWYSSHDILNLGGVYDFTEYEKKASDYCARDWSLITEKKDLSIAELNRYQMQCFKSAWIVNILHEGIGIPRIKNPSGHFNLTEDQEILEQTIESVEAKNWNPPFQSIDTINDIQVSWTLGAMLLHVASKIPLIDHHDGFLGHSTDNEGPHEIADGVLQNPNPPGLHNEDINSNHSIESKSNSIILNIMLLSFICILIMWILLKNIRKKRGYNRSMTGANGGILGNETIINSGNSPWRFLSPIMYFTLIANSISNSTMIIRHWLSRLLRGNYNSNQYQYTAVSGNNNDIPVDMDAFESGNNNNHTMNTASENVVINIGNDRLLGVSNKTPSVISKQYWSKKRYSGDSHNGIFQTADVMEGSSVLPFRASSVVGLANRNGSISNLTARTGSSPNLNGPTNNNLSTAVDRSSSPLATELNLTRSRSRVGFIIHEQSDEEEYTLVDGPLLSDDNPAAAWLQNANSRLASPRNSPRGSLDERRKKKEEIN
ncbi:nucleoside phosphatase family-domain-containing protein [Cokeromyces recurvatus]|uniref:nucleoside phosphatase family-domain-containing protein n=1 Tax=Cokeromyces recurvatus TaxID=90255 RepID=UPI0022207107|nr:nucleoside phosphatase family-domain-containing protein [Cokeromyces recurvatus]KAI7904833.1 nucleoside phosphatase family-domain-containing protein [Cokeromyces recurvatus]